MDKIELDITYNGRPAKVTIKKLTFGEVGAIRRQAMPIKLIGNQVIANPDQAMLQELCIEKSLVQAPFTINRAAIQGLDYETGTFLWNEVNALSRIDPDQKTIYEKKKKSNGNSGEEEELTSSEEEKSTTCSEATST